MVTNDVPAHTVQAVDSSNNSANNHQTVSWSMAHLVSLLVKFN
jgi:hypothetical protein